jgi:hypothetical protein
MRCAVWIEIASAASAITAPNAASNAE